ncbi:MAG: hypothetical protein ABW215_03665 [Kibdelosporangium sp.]
MSTDEHPQVQVERADQEMAALDQQIAEAKDAAAEVARSNPFPAEGDEVAPVDPPYEEDDQGPAPSGA